MFRGTAFLTKEGKPAIIDHGQGSKRNQIAFGDASEQDLQWLVRLSSRLRKTSTAGHRVLIRRILRKPLCAVARFTAFPPCPAPHNATAGRAPRRSATTTVSGSSLLPTSSPPATRSVCWSVFRPRARLECLGFGRKAKDEIDVARCRPTRFDYSTASLKHPVQII